MVLKKEDIHASLNKNDLDVLKAILIKIAQYRTEQGKPLNHYFVINFDEPYADDIAQLLLAHGHYDTECDSNSLLFQGISGMKKVSVKNCSACGRDHEDVVLITDPKDGERRFVCPHYKLDVYVE